jgi:hypothetical protein
MERGPRPGRRWYVAGSAIAALGVVGGIALLVASIYGLASAAPDGHHAFTAGDGTSVHLDAGVPKLVYVSVAQPGPRSLRCTATAADGRRAELARTDGTLHFGEWRSLFTITAKDGGDYTIGCCTGGPTPRFAVGDDISTLEAVSPLLAFGVGAAGVTIGAVVALAPAVLRRRRAAQPSSN